jgi:hypothetical protein
MKRSIPRACRSSTFFSYYPCPSVRHHKLFTHFLFSCYQTSYVVYSTLYLHVHKSFLIRSVLCSEIKKTLVRHARVMLFLRGRGCEIIFALMSRVTVRLRAYASGRQCLALLLHSTHAPVYESVRTLWTSWKAVLYRGFIAVRDRRPLLSPPPFPSDPFA